jgi:ribonuclease-3
MSLNLLSTRLGVEIEPELLATALTHRSFSYENGNQPNNERLEFLGDAVLGFVVTEHIYRTLQDLPEGELTKVKNAVVSANALAQAANQIGLGEFLRLGKGEEQTGGRHKTNLLADAFEAILGAALISVGLPAATYLIEKFVFPMLENPDALRANSDPKTTLQELVLSAGKEMPKYSVNHEGPDHDRTFFAELLIGDEVIATGVGRSKKSAETAAAIVALEKLQG